MDILNPVHNCSCYIQLLSLHLRYTLQVDVFSQLKNSLTWLKKLQATIKMVACSFVLRGEMLY